MKKIKLKVFALVGVLSLAMLFFVQPREVEAYNTIVRAHRQVIQRPGGPVSSCLECDPQGICFVLSCTKIENEE